MGPLVGALMGNGGAGMEAMSSGGRSLEEQRGGLGGRGGTFLASCILLNSCSFNNVAPHRGGPPSSAAAAPGEPTAARPPKTMEAVLLPTSG